MRWAELSKYRFMLSPAGNGVQSSKTLEALLVLTIPIVTRSPAHKDLVRLGFPIVVVRKSARAKRGMPRKGKYPPSMQEPRHPNKAPSPFLRLPRKWSEVTKANLERWWAELSPRLESFRANCLTTDGHYC